MSMEVKMKKGLRSRDKHFFCTFAINATKEENRTMLKRSRRYTVL